MPLVNVSLPSITISSGNSTSNAARDFDAFAVTIYAPAVLTATQVTVEVEHSSSGTSFVTLQSGGTDVVLAAGKSVIISPPSFKQLRLTSTATEDQADVFKMTMLIHV